MASLNPVIERRVKMSHHTHIHCNDMKVGEVYACGNCGIELEVIKNCNHEGHDQCCDSCADESADCNFTCCGADMVKK